MFGYIFESFWDPLKFWDPLHTSNSKIEMADIDDVGEISDMLEDWLFFFAYGYVALLIVLSLILTCIFERSLQRVRSFGRILGSLIIFFVVFCVIGYAHGSFAPKGVPGSIGININDLFYTIWDMTVWVVVGQTERTPYLLQLLCLGFKSLASSIAWLYDKTIGSPEFIWGSPFMITFTTVVIFHAVWAHSILNEAFIVQISGLVEKLMVMVMNAVVQLEERFWPTPGWLVTVQRPDTTDCRICWEIIQPQVRAYTCPHHNCGNTFHQKCIARLADSPAGAKKCPLCQRFTLLVRQITAK